MSATAGGIRITAADRAAAATAKVRPAHLFFPYGKTPTQGTVVHPSNLDYFGGHVLTSTKIFNAYVDSAPGEAGEISLFEKNYSASSMIHMTDEYVGTSASNRYPFSGNVGVTFPNVGSIGDADLLIILHAVASFIGPGGYGHMYHIFLPKGLNFCGTGTIVPAGVCSAGAATPGFCAFHTSVVFSDIGETIFSLEPFLPTSLCGVDNATATPTKGTPNGLQNDTNYSALSHEETEAITDPDPGTGWINPVPFYPAEIGDLCAYDVGPFVNGFSTPTNTDINGHLYRIQFEYSNKQIGCNNSPP